LTEFKETVADPKNATVLQVLDAIDKILPKLGIDAKEVDTKEVKFTMGK
jgi:hypothetical protein